MRSGHFLERKVCISIVAIVKDSSILIHLTTYRKMNLKLKGGEQTTTKKNVESNEIDFTMDASS